MCTLEREQRGEIYTIQSERWWKVLAVLEGKKWWVKNFREEQAASYGDNMGVIGKEKGEGKHDS